MQTQLSHSLKPLKSNTSFLILKIFGNAAPLCSWLRMSTALGTGMVLSPSITLIVNLHAYETRRKSFPELI